MRRTLSLLLSGVFVTLISVPLILFAFGARGAPVQNRAPTERPPLTLDTLFDTESMTRLGDYLRESMPLLADLVAFDARIDRRLRDSPNPDVVLGRGSWLFFEDTRSQVCVDADLGAYVAENLDRAQRLVQATGRRLVVAVAPDKASIYPERLTDDFPCSQLTAQTLSRISTSAGLVSGWDELRAAKGDELLYFETDTHWTSAGAAIFSELLIDRLSPGVWQEDFIAEQGRRQEPTDLTIMIGDPRVEAETEYITRVPRTDSVSERIPSVDQVGNRVDGVTATRWRSQPASAALIAEPTVLLHDSFGWAVLPLISGYFADVAFVRQPDPAASYAKALLDDAATVVLLITQRGFYDKVVALDLAARFAVAFEDELNPLETAVTWDDSIARVVVGESPGDQYVIVRLVPGTTTATLRVDGRERIVTEAIPAIGVSADGAGVAFELVSGEIEISAVSVGR